MEDKKEKKYLKYVTNNSLSKLKKLLSQTPTLNLSCTKRDYPKPNAIHIACSNGHYDILVFLFSQKNLSLTSTDQDKYNALHHACENGFFDIILYILENVGSKEVNAVTKFGDSALHRLCCCYSEMKKKRNEKMFIEVVEKMILKGIRVDLKNEDGKCCYELCGKSSKLGKLLKEKMGMIKEKNRLSLGEFIKIKNDGIMLDKMKEKLELIKRFEKEKDEVVKEEVEKANNQTINELKEKIKKLNEKLEKREKAIENKKGIINKMKKDMDEEHDVIKDKLQSMKKKSKKKFSMFEDQVKKLEKKLVDKEMIIKEQKKILGVKKEQLQLKESIIESNKSVIVMKEEQIEQVKDLEVELEKTSKVKKQIEGMLKDKLANLIKKDVMIKDLYKAIDDLQAKNQKKLDKLKSKAKTRIKLEREKGNLEIKIKEEKILDLERKIDRIKGDHDEKIEQLNEKWRIGETVIEDFRNLVDKKDREIKGYLKVIKDLERRLERTKDKVTRQDELIMKKEKRMSGVRSTENDLKRIERHKTSLENRLKLKDDAIHNREKRIKEFETKYRLKSTELNRVKNSSTEKISKLSKRNEKLREQNIEWQKKLKSMKNEITLKEAKLNRGGGKGSRKRILQLETDLKTQSDKLVGVMRKNKTYLKQIEILKEKLAKKGKFKLF